jgi:hypothetical protein
MLWIRIQPFNVIQVSVSVSTVKAFVIPYLRITNSFKIKNLKNRSQLSIQKYQNVSKLDLLHRVRNSKLPQTSDTKKPMTEFFPLCTVK